MAARQDKGGMYSMESNEQRNALHIVKVDTITWVVDWTDMFKYRQMQIP